MASFLDRLAAVVFASAALALFAAMPIWHRVAESPEAESRQTISARDFSTLVEAMTKAHATGEAEGGVPIVHPPAGDVYVIARRFEFTPILQLDVGRTYRLHIASTDVVHGFNFPLGKAETLLVPGWATTVTVTPTHPGLYAMQCSEYCGLSHSRMKARVRVMP
ncbi:MAG: hypothetical protein HQL37_10185 [Alphaproteobacteria bacterium]|nr:hypothetical protein [Alphaproteobacteria bacterium]